jgi:alanine-synthesizing transaminase
MPKKHAKKNMQEKFYLTNKLPPYIFAAIYKLKLEASQKGLEIIDFGMGNPDLAPPDHVIKKLAELSENPKLYGYSVTGGIEELKKAVTNYYQRRFEVELDYKSEALVTIGAKEGIASLATAISDRDNYMIVPSPSYPIHTFAFVISNSNIVHLNALTGEEFLQKFKSYIEAAHKKPLAVIVSFPCNPTSETVGIDFYQELVDFCKKYQIYIISDLAYSELYFDEKDKPASILQVKGAKDLAIEFSSVSKSYCLAGARIGFAVGNKNLIAALYKIKSYLDYGSFTPLQMAAIEALDAKTDDYLQKLRLEYKNRSEFLVNILQKELNWEFKQPKASMYLWGKLPSKFSSLTSFEFCQKLIKEIGVALSPGSSFGNNGEGYVRFSLIQKNDAVINAVSKMKKLFN